MSITLTQTARHRIQSFLEKRGKGIGVRLAVETTGCSGFAYKLEYLDDLKKTDVTYNQEGILIAIDKKYLLLLEGVELDFVTEGVQEGFKFNNPNATAVCGCGKSFAVK